MAESDSVPALASAARLTTAFYAWEERGRGWWVWDYPVDPEPPFRAFTPSGRRLPASRDDGRKPARLALWLRAIFRSDEQAIEDEDSEIDEPSPERDRLREIVEIQIALGPEIKVAAEFAEHFLLSLSTCNDPLGFEVIGTGEGITIQIACSRTDAPQVQEQLRSHFPDAVFSDSERILSTAWNSARGDPVIVDFGLSQEFMRPLRTFSKFDPDPLIAVTGALTDLADGEIGLLQVLFKAVRAPWNGQVLRSVTNWQGGAFFADAPKLLPLAKEKTDRPLFAAVIRVASRSPVQGRAWHIAKRLGGAFTQISNPSSNELIALANHDYPVEAHVQSVLDRLTYRSGAILNSQELVALVHPPSTTVRTPRLARGHRRTKAAPKALVGKEFVMGENVHGGTRGLVGLTTDQRLRHVHVIGASGTGKSTLILNTIVQDLEQGHGLALIDPHGDLVDQVLARVPEKRIDDVILVDPADTERPVAFNILSAHSDLEKTLLSSDLVAVFRRLSTTWGDQMTSVLSNAVLAFLESTRGGNLADLRRFLIEKDYREEFLATVTDPEVVYYWKKEFPLLAGRPQAPLLTRLDTFLRPKIVRSMMVQPSSRLDFSAIMNEGKVLLVKLAQGAIGEENAALLGTLFVAKVHQLALGRQSISELERRPFYVYCDEFQHFVTPSMATLLTGARKYRVGLVLAHQELRQLWNQERDVASAVLANAATRVCFRVGDDDAKKLEEGFATFTARDLQNLGVGQAVCRVERGEWDFSITTNPLPGRDLAVAGATAVRIVQRSREAHSAPVVQTLKTVEAVDEQAIPASIQKQRVTLSESPKPEQQSEPATPLPDWSHLRRPGRGGAQHKYLQELVRRWADANGWRATIEQQVLDGLGSVDVALTKGEHRVAVEISVSSTVDYEIGNLQKCLAAGFHSVALVAVEKRTIKALRGRVAETFRAQEQARTTVVDPEELFGFLKQVDQATSAITERHSRGFKVQVRRSRQPAAQSDAIVQTIIGALKRMRK